MTRRRHIPALLLALLASASCRIEKPFVRSNPMDPASIYDFELQGPDSTHSRGEQFELVLASTPEMPAGEYYLEWDAADWIDENTRETREIVLSLGNGAFVAHSATARYRLIFLGVELDDVVVGRQVQVGQKAVAMALSCAPFTQPLQACDATPTAPGQVIPVYLELRDPAGGLLREVEWAVQRTLLISRNPAVVSTLPVTSDPNGIVRIRAESAGTTWVVVRTDDAVDSVRVIVAP